MKLSYVKGDFYSTAWRHNEFRLHKIICKDPKILGDHFELF